MTARRESFNGLFLVKGFPTSSGRSDPARRMTDGIFVASYVRLCSIDYRAAPHYRPVKAYVRLQDLTPILGFVYNSGCKNVTDFAYGSFRAYWDTVVNPLTPDLSSTATQVGGFASASAAKSAGGTVTYTIPNKAGTHSFFYHVVPDRSASTGPMRTITQTFQWTEPISSSSELPPKFRLHG